MGKKHRTNEDNMARAIRRATSADIQRVLTSPRPKPGQSSSVRDVMPDAPKRKKAKVPKKHIRRVEKSLRDVLKNVQRPLNTTGNGVGNNGNLTDDEVENLLRELESANDMLSPSKYTTHTEPGVNVAKGYVPLVTRAESALSQIEKRMAERNPVENTLNGDTQRAAALSQHITLARLRVLNRRGR